MLKLWLADKVLDAVEGDDQLSNDAITIVQMTISSICQTEGNGKIDYQKYNLPFPSFLIIMVPMGVSLRRNAYCKM